MIIIGITGGIGTGKTTATSYLVSKGFAHIDADQIGRDLTADGQPILEIIGKEFGCVNKIDKKPYNKIKKDSNGLVLDRKALANVVFKDENKRKKFDAIIHKEIKKIIDKKIAYYNNQEETRNNKGSNTKPIFPAILLDAPLLFEAQLNDRCDVVILITADMNKRIDRVVKRDDTNVEAVRDRINNQMDDEYKASHSDFVIDNSKEEKDLFSQLDNILISLGI